MTSFGASPYSDPTLRPCALIELEPNSGFRVGLEERYAALTEELPLKGAMAMRTNGNGELPFAETLRARLPWMQQAIGLVERQVRVALWADRAEKGLLAASLYSLDKAKCPSRPRCYFAKRSAPYALEINRWGRWRLAAAPQFSQKGKM